jgi:hypothetical protein
VPGLFASQLAHDRDTPSCRATATVMPGEGDPAQVRYGLASSEVFAVSGTFPRWPGPHFGVMLVRDLPQRLLSLADDVRCVSEYLSVRLRHLHHWYLLHFVAYP